MPEYVLFVREEEMFTPEEAAKSWPRQSVRLDVLKPGDMLKLQGDFIQITVSVASTEHLAKGY